MTYSYSGNWRDITSESARIPQVHQGPKSTQTKSFAGASSAVEPLSLSERFPAPNVMQVWQQKATVKALTRVGLHRESSAGQDSSGSSLIIAKAAKEDNGRYLCAANNAEGPGLSKLVTVTVLEPPWFPVRGHEVVVQVRGAAVLECSVRGDAPLAVQWRRDGQVLPLIGSKYSVEQEHGEETTKLKLTLNDALASDGGAYECQAENLHGSNSLVYSLVVRVLKGRSIRHVGQLTAVAGQTLSVTCPVGGYPIDKITWQKDGVQLPATHHQRVHVNGTLTIAAVTREGDEGSYSCTALDKQGRSDHQTLHIQVMVPPRLAPVVFVGGTSAGLPAQATCIVLSGDPPITLRWLKDGQAITAAASGVLISQHSEISSTLSIDRTSGEHSGNYTCTASNGARTTSSSAALTINIPPTWLVEPSDADVSLGASLEIPCSASGFPTPRVTWRKQTHSGNWRDITSESTRIPQVHQGPKSTQTETFAGASSAVEPLSLSERFPAPNVMQVWQQKATVKALTRVGLHRESSAGQDSSGSSLIIAKAAKEDHGRYLCAANNAEGPGLSKLVMVTVLEPPWFPIRGRELVVQVRGAAVLECSVRGDAPLAVQWRRDGQVLPLIGSKYSVEQEHGEESTKLKLTLNDALASDGGAYECQAENLHGSNSLVYSLVVRDVPSAPSGVKVSEKGARFIALEWSASAERASVPESSDINFIVFYATVEGSYKEIKVPTYFARITGLDPATRYLLRVAAENSVGRSDATEVLMTATLEEPPTGPPRNLKVVDVSKRSVVLRWEAPLANSTNGLIRGYILGYRKNSDVRISDSTIEVSMDGLRPHSRYALTVQAYNSEGTGPSTPAITIVTKEDVPSSPPEKVICEAISASEIFVTWTPPHPDGANGRIVSYKVHYEKADHIKGIGFSGSSSQITPLRSLLPSHHEQKFTNREISSNFRLDSEPEAPHSAPEPPGEVLVNDGLETRLTSLRAFSNFSVTVAAATAVGVGVPSTPIICATAEGVPTAPTAVKVVLSSKRKAIVSWRPPDSPRGRITHYAVQWRPVVDSVGNTREVTVPGDSQHCELLDLPFDETVQVVVLGYTRVGAGAASQPASIVVSETIPAGVWSVGGRVSVAWKESISMPCNVVGLLPPTRSWSRDGLFLNQDSRVSILDDGEMRILDAQRSHSGRYTCTATNTHGSDSVTYHLSVISE
ncbi:Down syndrome cell adhesion molecule-like protein Dscam2 [Hyalella azteca]|uniref:Down syndrome cell adhesion molecule-like protein Dscam2 n=1 Tax=Hyalella azteca TaxID=294128 RepID=A0A979FQU8_HYAAZ|nr:Down syndrome cell adhesion molecule-like protein Dscam2 [Hyalella azteca]